jgi:hypothetical protein
MLPQAQRRSALTACEGRMWRVISMPILGIFHQTFPDGLCDSLQVDLPSMQAEPVTDCIATEQQRIFSASKT